MPLVEPLPGDEAPPPVPELLLVVEPELPEPPLAVEPEPPEPVEPEPVEPELPVPPVPELLLVVEPSELAVADEPPAVEVELAELDLLPVAVALPVLEPPLLEVEVDPVPDPVLEVVVLSPPLLPLLADEDPFVLLPLLELAVVEFPTGDIGPIGFTPTELPTLMPEVIPPIFVTGAIGVIGADAEGADIAL
jgi:hypothetical protein